jgi:hypothetical protein
MLEQEDNHPWEVVVAPGIEVGEDRRVHLPDWAAAMRAGR